MECLKETNQCVNTEFTKDPSKLMAETLEILGGKWKILILWHLSQKPQQRFGELKKLIPDISQRILTLQLRAMEEGGLVIREVFPEIPPRVEYRITPKAMGLQEVFTAICNWRRNFPD